MAEGKYRFDALLGGGGMAEVYSASKVGAEGFTRRVAIKRVLPGFSDDPEFAKMFVAEAQISSRLVHPNIVSVIDFDRDDDGRLFLVLELVDGRDLDALAATGPLPFHVLNYVAVELLRGLGYAHDLPLGSQIKGVVHRDVSPHNILLSWEGAVKVSDFGIAKARDASAATASTLIKGKPAYMSPEQANGQPLDGRSDLFAVGVMLWELLVGRRLFVGEDTRTTLAAVMFGKIPRPRSLRPEVPKDLERIVMKLLERDLPARYATAEQAVAELLKCADVKGGRDALIAVMNERFKQPSRKPVTPQVTIAEAATVASTPRAQRRKKPVKWLVIAAVAAVVAVGAYAAAMVVMGGGKAAVPVDAGVEHHGHANGAGWFRVDDVLIDAGSIDSAATVAPTATKTIIDPKYVGPACTAYLKELDLRAGQSDLPSVDREGYSRFAGIKRWHLAEAFESNGVTKSEEADCSDELQKMLRESRGSGGRK